MHLYLRATSIHLSEDHAKALDDEFFLSHPAAYFASRISSLLAAEHSVAVPTPADPKQSTPADDAIVARAPEGAESEG